MTSIREQQPVLWLYLLFSFCFCIKLFIISHELCTLIMVCCSWIIGLVSTEGGRYQTMSLIWLDHSLMRRCGVYLSSVYSVIINTVQNLLHFQWNEKQFRVFEKCNLAWAFTHRLVWNIWTRPVLNMTD